MDSLQTLLSQQGITLGPQCRKTETAVVYEACYSYQNLPCLVRVQPVQGDQVTLQREIEAHCLLKHDSIVQVYQAFWHQDSEGWQLVMVLERCEMNLMTEINNRIEYFFPFEEITLWAFLRSIVSACAYMQTQRIAHRDICPQCIALTGSKAAKLEGFGSSKVIPFSIWQTVTGHHYFISPLLREAYSKGQISVYHDAYKSDVYSLGLVVLLMASLRQTNGIIGSVAERGAMLEMEIAGLVYSEQLKNAIRWMLTEEESARPSFVDLEKWLNPEIEGKFVEMQVNSQTFPVEVQEAVPEPAPCVQQAFPTPSEIEASWRAKAQLQAETHAEKAVPDAAPQPDQPTAPVDTNVRPTPIVEVVGKGKRSVGCSSVSCCLI